MHSRVQNTFMSHEMSNDNTVSNFTETEDLIAHSFQKF